MSKQVLNVFKVLGTLVLAVTVWAVMFNETGVLPTAWDSVIKPINETWHGVTGDSKAVLIPEFKKATGGNYKLKGGLTHATSTLKGK